LWQVGEFDLHTAVDELWAAAVRDGLVAELGADHVQQSLADAFAPVRDDLPHDDVIETEDEFGGPTFAEICRTADERRAADDADLDPELARAQRLASDDIALDRAWRELNGARDLPEATRQAADHLIKFGDLERWKKWFDMHSAQERAAILQHLEQRKGTRGK
jgi:hypothetical protein